MNEYDRLHRQAQRYKELYPKGTRILLLHMGNDPRPVEDDMRGTVMFVDDILTENNAQCQAAVTEFQNKMRKSATEFTDSMKTVVSDTEKRVGRISDYYSNNLSMLTDTAEKYLSRIFWITVIPSAITALYYLTLLILRLI